MSGKEVYQTLASLSTYQDVVNSVALKELPVKRVCDIAAKSIKAWQLVMDEFNDVVSVLSNSDRAEDQIYCSAFNKALQIVLTANRYRRENVAL